MSKVSKAAAKLFVGCESGRVGNTEVMVAGGVVKMYVGGAMIAELETWGTIGAGWELRCQDSGNRDKVSVERIMAIMGELWLPLIVLRGLGGNWQVWYKPEGADVGQLVTECADDLYVGVMRSQMTGEGMVLDRGDQPILFTVGWIPRLPARVG